ncbi:hypothetical protein, partial [Leucobacter sp. M11]|uniref:hypothetical protein n=1 Tax=Leucobacter sp. M11 TaxID=2993565 RepID=UPI002D7E6332
MRALRRLPGRPSMRPEQRDAAAAIGLLIGGLVMLPSGLRLGLSFGAALSLPTWLSVLIILLAS